MSTTEATTPVPEPSAGTLVGRARALRPKLLERQAETEELRAYPETTHREFLEAGFYRMLVPRRFGGYEVDLPTFFRVVVELARGCPSTAWCFCLGAGHALQIATWFDERAQAELFGDGDFRCPAMGAPLGSAVRTTDGAWEISGTWPYCSGAPYATHFLGHTFPAGEGPDGGPGPVLLFVAPRSAWTMLDDWGDLLGLKGSGSQSIRLRRGRIPAHFALESTWMGDVDVSGGSPGYRLHGNPLYAGRPLSFFQAELAAIMVGATKGALDEYERLLTTRSTQRPPIRLRARDPDYQRWYGQAIGRLVTGEAALLHAMEEWMAIAQGNIEGGPPFRREDDLRLNSVGREVMTIAWNVMQGIVFRTAGSSAARDSERLQRIFRDTAMGWGHYASVLGDSLDRELGQRALGLQPALDPDAFSGEARPGRLAGGGAQDA